MKPIITDKVCITDTEESKYFEVNDTLTIVGISGDLYAVSNGIISRWINKEFLKLKSLRDTTTYQTFQEKLESLSIQHERFMLLSKGEKNPLSDAYSSLAANTLSTYSYILGLFEIYKAEYSNAHDCLN